MANTTLHVGNLSFQTSEEDLQAAFAGYGDVRAVRMMLDRESGRPRGFAFVEMGTEGQAAAAMEALNQKAFQGRTLSVGRARARS